MREGDREVQELVADLAAGRLDRGQFIRRAAALGLSASAAASLLAGPGAAFAAGSTLRVRADYDLQTVDPAFLPTHVDSMIADTVFEGLISYEPTSFKIKNQLAESFEPSKNGLSYHFKLKRGIPFHGGYGEVTSEDVKYSYERIAGLTKPNLHATYQGDWATLSHVTTEGKYAGTIHLRKAFAPLMRSTLPEPSGYIVSKKAVEKLGKKFGTHPIGSGPYEFVSWTPKQKILLKRFAGWGGASKNMLAHNAFGTIEILPISEDSAAQTALQAGDLDFGVISTGAVDHLKRDTSLRVIDRPTLNYSFINMNVKDPLLKNRELRLAVRSAIDVPGILAAAYDNRYTRAYAIIPKAMGVGYWAGAPHYQHDPDKAKAYLKKSGLQNVSLNIAVVDAEADRTVAQVVQSDLQAVGIKCTITAQDNSTFNDIPGAGAGGKHRQLVYSAYVTEPDPSWSIVWFTCPQVGEWNFAEWCDKSFQKLYDQAIVETNQAKRSKMYVHMQQIWDQAVNTIWVGYPTLYFAGKKSIVPALRPDGTISLRGFHPA